MVEERVRHHDDTLLDCHPTAEGQVEGDSAIGHVQAVLVDGRTPILRLVVVRLLVLVGNQVCASRDISHQEVAALDGNWSPGHGHIFQRLIDEITVGAEEVASAFDEGHALIVVVGSGRLVERGGDGDLSGRIEAVKDGVGDDATMVNETLGADRPADLPASRVEELAAGED